MYAITMDGEALHYYGSSRYGWGPIDQCDPSNTKAERVHFDTREKAQELIEARSPFWKGAYIVHVELLDPPKKRGRPATGHAMSAAERKAKQRAELPGYSMDVSMTECSDTALHTALQRALSNGDQVIGEMLVGEYNRRLKERG